MPSNRSKRKENKLLNRVTIMSSSDGLLKDLRYHESEIALSYGQAFLVRLGALNQLALSAFLKFDKDVAWIDPEVVIT